MIRIGDDLVRAVEESLREAGDLSTTAKKTVIHEHLRRSGALGAGEPRPGRPTVAALVQSPDRPERWEALGVRIAAKIRSGLQGEVAFL